MSSRGNHIGSFLLHRTRSKTVRQRHLTGNQYEKRKTFNFNGNQNYLHRKISGRPSSHGSHGPNQHALGTDYFKHLHGDVQRRPDFDFGFGSSASADGHREIHRVDGAEYAWEKRGDLQLFQISTKAQTVFNCYRCGYAIRSKLVAIKCDNWDWRMCYHCYNQSIRDGTTEQE